MHKFACLLAIGLTALPVAAAAQDATWDGAYIGLLGGASFGSTDFKSYEADYPDYLYPGGSDDGASGQLSLRLGYDKQVGKVVAGAFVDATFLDLSTRYLIIENGLPTDKYDYNNQIDFLLNLEGRLGYEVTEGTLFYAHGGLAYARTESSFESWIFGRRTFSWEDDRLGYTVGLGVERALTVNLSLVADYSFTDLGDAEHDLGLITYKINENISINSVKAGLNLRF